MFAFLSQSENTGAKSAYQRRYYDAATSWRYRTMADTKIQHEVVRDNGLDNEHLCYITSQSLHLAEARGYQALIADPRFRCDHCSRTARSRRNLCVPLDL